ncbi:MAG: hemolysin III family protein [Ilumatobacteraceae bacterium]|nr:hemolysin III family protein [Ilumatobacteraceae bacterium]
MSLADVCLEPRPTWRGRLHAWGFFVALPAGALLIAAAEGTAATVAVTVYVASLLAMLGTSAAYHRLATTVRQRQIMQRLDHCTIYLLIAGTYVPLCIIVMPPSWGIPVLCVVGAGALLGIVLKFVAFDRTRWLHYSLYPLLGWIAVVSAPVLITHLTVTQIALVVGGGIAYTVGIPVLARRWPDPWPTTFGYHEVWHGFTVVAAALHFAAVGAVVA